MRACRAAWRRLGCVLLLAAVLAAGCARAVAPPIVTTPRFPEYMFPALTPPEPALADLMGRHDAGWRWFQAGDLERAEREFTDVLKRSPQFYPSETALAYVALAQSEHAAALERFDRVLQAYSAYVPALVGRGETLLAMGREADALPDFEAAVTLDPTLAAVSRRVDVLRARALQANVAAARRAAQTNRLDEAARLYEQALAASPESAFLVRDLAEVEARQGKTEQALARYRRAIELDPSDTASRIRIGEILDARGDIEGAKAMYVEASAIEPSAELRRRIDALETRLAYLRLPAEYREISEAASVTRADLAALIGLRLPNLLQMVPAQPVLITDARNHWASKWIMTTARAGVMEPFANHTFQPGTPVRRRDLAQAVSRLLKIIGSRRPGLLKEWQSRVQRIADVGVSNLNYADVSLSVVAGILPLAADGSFELSRPVSGAEAVEAIARIERLSDPMQ